MHLVCSGTAHGNPTLLLDAAKNAASAQKGWAPGCVVSDRNSKSVRHPSAYAVGYNMPRLKALVRRESTHLHGFRCIFEGHGGMLRAGHWEPKKFNASLYDVLMYSFAREDKNVIYQHLDSIREALIYLMTESQEFIDAIELSTSSLQAATKRFDLFRLNLQEIIGIGKKEPRCFSMQVKEKLFNSNNTCALCGQRIQDIDDAAVDHIKQYWIGGKTDWENARLSHRYCNWARPRKD